MADQLTVYTDGRTGHDGRGYAYQMEWSYNFRAPSAIDISKGQLTFLIIAFSMNRLRSFILFD